MIRVAPSDITHKLSVDLDETEAAQWVGKTYMPLAQTIKHRSVFQRYAEGLRWEETDLFTQIYPRRFAEGQVVRGCATLEQLTAHYYARVDAMFADMKAHGFRTQICRVPTAFPVVIGPDGAPVIGNQGNHRLAMAKVLKLPSVVVDVRGSLSDVQCEYEVVTMRPELHEGARDIPAMTTLEERHAYYELALAADGEVVELGTWLGASTVFLAAGVRDSKSRPGHSYDRFVWKPIHEYKAGAPLSQPMMTQVLDNLGPLAPFVTLHEGEMLQQRWRGGPIGLLVADGPKRVREIAATLKNFATHIPPGGHMAWQDFAYFPAYDIPVCLDRLERNRKITFVESVFPGTTAVFRVAKQLTAADVANFDLSKWTPDEILSTWERWRNRLAEGMRPRWMCGAAMFLCDRGAQSQGVSLFKSLLNEYPEQIVPKWEYFKEKRSSVAAKYSALTACV